jgi:NADPH-dependent 2,4-dienoyl-CoA reductase/sulfur reductase-like enzyme
MARIDRRARSDRPMSTASVIGGGPAGLIAAEVLARAGVAVTVYDRMPSVGRTGDTPGLRWSLGRDGGRRG